MKDTTLYYIAILVALVIFYKYFCTCSKEGYDNLATVSVNTIMRTARVWHQGGRIRARDGKMYSFSDVERIMNSFRWQQGLLWKMYKETSKVTVLTRSDLSLIVNNPVPSSEQLGNMGRIGSEKYYLLSMLVEIFLGTSKVGIQTFKYLTTGKG